MTRSTTWKNYVDQEGNFALPRYLYEQSNDLMKQCLDFGVMSIPDKDRLRAFKQAVKVSFKKRWNDVAEALSSFGIIEQCTCDSKDFCRFCGGSRYQLSGALSPDEVREFSVALASDDPKLAQKLREGIEKINKDIGE